MKITHFVLVAIVALIFVFSVASTVNAEGIKLTHEDLSEVTFVTFKDEHNNVVFPAMSTVSITSKSDGRSFGFMTLCDMLFDLPAGEYMFAGAKLVLTE